MIVELLLQGEGERENKAEKNMGTCSCNPGYKGTVCDQCNTRYVKVGETCEGKYRGTCC